MTHKYKKVVGIVKFYYTLHISNEKKKRYLCGLMSNGVWIINGTNDEKAGKKWS